MLEFTFTVTEEEVQNKWAKQVSSERWIQMYKKLSKSHAHWDTDIKVAEFIITHLKDYIKEYLPADLPEVLQPLLLEYVKNDIKENNLKNRDIKLEDVSGEDELYAIETLRDYSFITYDDAVNLICDAIELGRENSSATRSLEDYDTAELLAEISRRV